MERLARRRLLAVAAGSASLAGCLQGADPDDGDDGDDDGNGGDDGSPDEPADGPGSADAGDHPVGAAAPDGDFPESCPDYERVGDVVCYDAVDVEAADAYLAPGRRTVTTDGRVEFTLVNRSDVEMMSNFYNWRVHKLVDGEWFHVAPAGHNDPAMNLAPGDTHTWTVQFDNAGIDDGGSVARWGGESEITVEGVGGGYYAFRGRGLLQDDDHTEATAYGATFELDAEPIEVTPTNAIETTEWNDDTLVATSTRGDPDGEYSRRGAYELERVEDPAGTPRTMIAEQVIGKDRLRDAIALAHAHDADRVRIEEYDSTTPIFGARTDGSYAFDGEYYAVSTYELQD